MKIPKLFLIIDDDSFNNRLCGVVLSRTFVDPNILAFTQPETAIKYLETEFINAPVETVLFLDINMPVLTGWQVLDELQKSPLNIKDHLTIFILSSSIDLYDKTKAKENPWVTAYLEKPLRREKLQEIFGNGE